jgi:DNA-binding NarL/FixJ family response regulator
MPDESTNTTDSKVRTMHADGKSDHEIADELGISVMDVEEGLVRTMPMVHAAGEKALN